MWRSNFRFSRSQHTVCVIATCLLALTGFRPNIAEAGTPLVQVAELQDSPFYEQLFKRHPQRVEAAPASLAPQLLAAPDQSLAVPLLRKPAVRVVTPLAPALAGFPAGNSEAAPPDQMPRSASPRSGGYRTMCVRLCDGFYWPVRYGAGSSELVSDDRMCQSECGADARMFYQPIGSSGPDDLRDLNGKPYSKLVNALRYRKVYDPQCRCHADPWSPAERMRHADYAVGSVPGGGLQVEKAASWNSLMAVEPSFALAASDVIRGAVPAVAIKTDLPEVVASEGSAASDDSLVTVNLPLPSTLPKARRTKTKPAAIGLNGPLLAMQPASALGVGLPQQARAGLIKVIAPAPVNSGWFSSGKLIDVFGQLGIKGR